MTVCLMKEFLVKLNTNMFLLWSPRVSASSFNLTDVPNVSPLSRCRVGTERPHLDSELRLSRYHLRRSIGLLEPPSGRTFDPPAAPAEPLSGTFKTANGPVSNRSRLDKRPSRGFSGVQSSRGEERAEPKHTERSNVSIYNQLNKTIKTFSSFLFHFTLQINPLIYNPAKKHIHLSVLRF